MGEKRSAIGHVDVKSGKLLLFDFGLIAGFEGPSAAKDAVIAALEAGQTQIEHEVIVGVVVQGVAPGRYTVYSEPYVSEDFEGLRRAVTIDFSQAPSVKTIELGNIGVDCARIGVFDVDAVGPFNHEEATDGKADIVFWGLHEDEVAKRFEAPAIEGTGYGFVDLPVERAIAIGEKLQALRESGELRFAFDFRPHTDDYALLAQIRASDDESGTIDVGGLAVCGFMTSWGDGFFPVRLDVDAQGAPVRCTITFATEEALDAMREVNGM